LLTDYPDAQSRDMRWDLAAAATSAEYANFMVDNMQKGWRSQMCRAVRLRHSMHASSTFGHLSEWKYQLVVLKPEWQPNAGKQCFEECDHQSGWCNFCGGKGNGACCKYGAFAKTPPEDDQVCAQFHPPEGAGRVCVHKDCAQRSTRYSGTKVMASTDQASDDWKECQEFCAESLISIAKDVLSGAVFNLDKSWWGQKHTCQCLAAGTEKAKLHRKFNTASISGPVRCTGEEGNYQTEEEKEETPHVPMKELEPCQKSPKVGSVEQLEEKHPEWLQKCYQNASALVLNQYNPFYKRFAKFVDQLAVRAGCSGANLRKMETEEFEEVSPEFDYGSFSDCDWDSQATLDRARGWTGTSKVVFDDQKKLKIRYPMPKWLKQLADQKSCLMKKYNSKSGMSGQESQVFESINER